MSNQRLETVRVKVEDAIFNLGATLANESMPGKARRKAQAAYDALMQAAVLLSDAVELTQEPK